MGFFDRFKKQVVEDEYTEIQLLEIELQIANDDRLYAQLVFDKAQQPCDGEIKYYQHKLTILKATEKAVSVARTKLKHANIKRNEELVIKADIKKYERDRHNAIVDNRTHNVMKRVMKLHLSAELYDVIMEEVKAEVGY